MPNCGKCKLAKGDGLVGCEGPCNSWYHYSCANLTKSEFEFLEKRKNVLYVCNNCLRNIEVTERNSLGNFNTILGTLNEKIERMGENMEVKLCSKLSEITSMIDDFKSTMRSLIRGELSDVLADNTNEVLLPKMNELLPKTKCAGDVVEKSSYRDMVKKNSILLKPRDTSQCNAATKSDLYQNINPLKENIAVSKVKNISNGGVVISFNSQEESNKLKLLASTKLADKYEVKEAGKLHPRIKVVGISEKHEEDTLVNLLVSQNKHVFKNKDTVTVINVKPTRKSRDVYQVILQLDDVSYRAALQAGNLAIGYDFCVVYDALEVRRCFKCCGFNHISKNCKNKQICPNCSGEHNINNCTISEKRCINCTHMSSVKPGLDTNHSAWDRGCPIYRGKLSLLKSDMLDVQ